MYEFVIVTIVAILALGLSFSIGFKIGHRIGLFVGVNKTIDIIEKKLKAKGYSEDAIKQQMNLFMGK